MARDPWESPFTPDELAQLARDDARRPARASGATPATVIERERAACPRCGSFDFKTKRTRSNARQILKRQCECERCGWRFTIVDIP